MTQIKSLRTGIKFKDTPIGKIPVDWEATTIENVCDILDGKRVPLNKEQRDKMKGDIPYYGANGIVDYINDYIFDEDLILLAEDGGYFEEYQTRPIAYLIHGKSWVNNHAHVLKVMGQANTNWVYYSLVHKNIVPFIKGGTRSKLNQADLRQIPISLPPFPEQKKIAEILATVDDAIEETGRIIEKTKELKKGLMQKLLTRGIGHKKFKETEIGEIPEVWEVVKLDKVVKGFYNGGTPDTKVKEYWDGNIPWVTGADFINQRIDQIRRYITMEGVKNSATNLISKGNLLIVTRTGVGKLAIAPFDIAISQDITGVITEAKRLLPDFLYRFLDYHEKKLKSLVQGTSINGLLREDLASLNICLPPLKEQKEIADILTASDLEIDSEEANKQNLETLKKSLMQVLLTGRVRVKLH